MYQPKRPSYEELLKALERLHYLANATELAWHPVNMDARILVAQGSA